MEKLSDEFRKQFNKRSRSGDAAPESTTLWKYFDAMFFRNQFVPRKSTGNLTFEGTDDANVTMNIEGNFTESLLD